MAGVRSVEVKGHISQNGNALGGGRLGLDAGNRGHVDEVESRGVVYRFAGAGGVEGAGFGRSVHC